MSAVRLCNVPRCSRKHIARGLCTTCYQRRRRYFMKLALYDDPTDAWIVTELERLREASRCEATIGSSLASSLHGGALLR